MVKNSEKNFFFKECCKIITRIFTFENEIMVQIIMILWHRE